MPRAEGNEAPHSKRQRTATAVPANGDQFRKEHTVEEANTPAKPEYYIQRNGMLLVSDGEHVHDEQWRIHAIDEHALKG